MLRLMSLVFSIAGPTLAGVFVTAALVVPQLYALTGIWGAAAIGFALALPVSWFIGRKIAGIAAGPARAG